MRTYLLLLTLVAVPAAAQTPAAPAPPGAATAPVAAAPAGRQYLLGAGDQIKVTVFDEPAFSGTYLVDTDGTFEYPYLGRIQARSRTTNDISSELKTGLADGWVNNPQITVEIFQYRPRNIFVVGEVRSPGAQTITGGSMTLTDALAKAGWVTQNAGTQIIVIHQAPDDFSRPVDVSQVDAARQTRINFLELMAGKLTANIELEDGDTVMVQRAERFYVNGQVKVTGQFTWEPGLTVRKALILAGGIADKGSSRRMRIIRVDPKTGKEQRISVDMNDEVRPDDTLEVLSRLL